MIPALLTTSVSRLHRFYLPTIDLDADMLMINHDMTSYTLLTGPEQYTCSDRRRKICNPKNALYQVNLSKSCILAIFLKHSNNIKTYCPVKVVQRETTLSKEILRKGYGYSLRKRIEI